MITKQLKRLLMVPSPHALRLRPHASTPEAPPPGSDEAPAPLSPSEPAPRRAPEVPSYLRAAPPGPGLPNPPPRPVDDPASLVPPGMRGFTDLRGTQPTSDAAARGPVLPFGPPIPSPSPTAAGADAALVPEGMRGFTSLTGTHPVSEAPTAPVLPFSTGARPAPATPSSPATAPALSLEQYASLCAELAATPDDAEALFARYGLGRPEARLAVDGFWRDRLARDPAAQERWQELYWHYRARSSGKSPHDPR